MKWNVRFLSSIGIISGVGLVTRKMVGLLSPVVELKKEGDVYTLLSVSTFRSMPMSFKIGEEFEDVKPDGRKVLYHIYCM